MKGYAEWLFRGKKGAYLPKIDMDIEYVFRLSQEDVEAIITEANAIITSDNPDKEKLFQAYIKKAQALQIGVSCRYKDKSNTSVRKALELKPDSAEAIVALGRIHKMNYADTNSEIKARKYFEKALKLKPDYVRAYYELAATYSRKDDYNKAVELLTTAIRIKPDFLTALLARADIYSENGEFEKSISDRTEAIRLNPDEWIIY
ncbi:MAG: tetratricopeptide repeat protein, partial [Treponema sp.]|nr:tetratricopeptide repeat protein [Treponema sp.]